jgi:hypothetical protein
MKAVTVRDDLVEALTRDLVGADPHEVIKGSPSRWYLTGFLAPYEAPPEVREDDAPDEDLGAGGEDSEDDQPPELASARKAPFPSSIGLSVLVPKATRALLVRVSFGDYKREEPSTPPPAASAGEDTPAPSRPEERWKRTPQEHELSIALPASGKVTKDLGATGMRVVVSVRPVPDAARINEPASAVSVFLVNHRDCTTGRARDELFAFQARLELAIEGGFVARPNVRGQGGDDPDEQIAELQYRDVFEYAVGHGVAAHADVREGAPCTRVWTTWLPTAEVERVEPGEVRGLTLSMEALAAATTADEVRGLLSALPEKYGAWIEQQAKTAVKDHQVEVLAGLMDAARSVRRRMVDGLEALDDADVLLAFRLANKTMARAARARDRAGKRGAPEWRPFQLAFVLLNLRAMHAPTHHDRAVIDLLFFPTGGGKTEAYLGLAAYTLVLRRLRTEGVGGAGVSVVMRYTLRLLTLDQLGRAAALICALELEREERAKSGDTRLGTWPFEIGLWVGKGATPNRMGEDKDYEPTTARMKVNAYQQDSAKNPAPVPLESCPWCDTKFTALSFRLTPSAAHPDNLVVYCANRDCDFSRRRALPMLTVDEPIYRRLPCFLIATVDKFAQLPWVGRTGALFGKVDRYDAGGFYGPCDPGVGRPLPGTKTEGGQLAPPDLVIQDELHLISGPLGTMVGLYETAIDLLCETKREGTTYGPKIIASTATVRRAEAQIKALFGRSAVTIFPPPGPNRRDSFFAYTAEVTARNARKYVGVSAPGRSLKVALLRTYLALLGAGKKAYDAHGAPADPYTTLLGYFNSLRELGGSRRIVEDEVTWRVRSYELRRRSSESAGDFASRSLGEPVELTSREPTHRVAKAKDRLAASMERADHVDVALATNMISVGLDIQRLGLMVVLGQPKTTAEYIQATSRVGRDEARPGLVVTLLNAHRARDRSHYERFNAYHASFYRAVEATSVTPFSPRAIDRGIAAVTVALARLGIAELTPPLGAEQVISPAVRERLAELPMRLATRTAQAIVNKEVAAEDSERVEKRVGALLSAWKRTVDKNHSVQARLQYQREETAPPPLLRDPLEPEPEDDDLRRFKAQRSLRDVEPSVDVFLRKPGALASKESR